MNNYTNTKLDEIIHNVDLSERDSEYLRKDISSLISSHNTALIEKIEKLRPNWQNDTALTMNETLDDCISIIQESEL